MAATSWAPLNDFLANIAVTCMAIDPSNPNTLYAGTGEGFFNADGVRGAGMFKTTDAGAQLDASAGHGIQRKLLLRQRHRRQSVEWSARLCSHALRCLAQS